MYDTKYICRYKSDDIFLETDLLTDDEKEFIRDELYREDLLNIFIMDEYSDDIINLEIKNLYEKIKNYQPFKECILKAASRYLSEDEELGLVLLLSFDYLDLTHNCISEYIETQKVSDENMNILKNKVFSE